jgi:hypothetical protein
VRIPELCLWPRPCRQAFWGGRSSRVNGAAFDVHPRVAMRILRHSKIAITMELYTMVPDEAPLAALKRLSDALGSAAVPGPRLQQQSTQQRDLAYPLGLAGLSNGPLK